MSKNSDFGLGLPRRDLVELFRDYKNYYHNDVGESTVIIIFDDGSGRLYNNATGSILFSFNDLEELENKLTRLIEPNYK